MKLTFLYVFLSLISLTSFSQEDSVTNRKFLKHIIDESIPQDILDDGLILVVESPYYGLRGDKKNEKENEKIKNLMDSIYKGAYVVAFQGMDREIWENTKVYKYWLTMDPASNKGGMVRFLISDHSIVMDKSLPDSARERAIKNTGIYSSTMHGYLDKLKLLIQYINQERLN